MKDLICTTAGLVAGFLTGLFGGWNAALSTLAVCIIADFATGLMVGAAGKSKKTHTGGLSSKTWMIGLMKKVMIVIVVLVMAAVDILAATYLDVGLHPGYIRDAVAIGFIVNEIISLIENAGLLGVPLPAAVTKAIEVLKTKEETK